MARFDLYVIGGGSGGVACGRRAAAYGAKVGLAESSRVGGTCVIRGCVPKKLMHYGAHFAEQFRLAKGYGWRLDEAPVLDFQALIEARNTEIQRLNDIYLGMLDRAGVTVHADRATVLGRTADGAFRIAVGGAEHEATNVLVAVGARPAKPVLPGVEHTVTSDEILESLYPMPKRLAVVGAGYIGVELASIFNGLGVQTSLILRADQPLRGFDEDLRRHMTAELERHGLDLRRNTVVTGIAPAGAGYRLDTTTGAIEADLVVYATGRDALPNTRHLGLDALGVAMDPVGAIEVDTAYKSSVPGLYAVGDCSDHAGQGLHSGQHDLTPVAIAEGRVIAETLYNNNPHEVAYASIPTAIFGMPQAGSVGMSESEARSRGHTVQVYKTDFRPMLYTLPGAANRTFMKLVVDSDTDRVLGCSMVGDDAAEIVQGLAIALTAGATKAQFDATVGVHPSAAEEFVTMYQPGTG
jgi:glutathione reductase (NADPH)